LSYRRPNCWELNWLRPGYWKLSCCMLRAPA
jgi:hypothetical protein